MTLYRERYSKLRVRYGKLRVWGVFFLYGLFFWNKTRKILVWQKNQQSLGFTSQRFYIPEADKIKKLKILARHT